MKDEDYNKLIEEINTSLNFSKTVIEKMKTPQFEFIFRDIELKLQQFQIIEDNLKSKQSQMEFYSSNPQQPDGLDTEKTNNFNSIQINSIDNREKSKNSVQLEQILNKYFQKNTYNQNQAFNYCQEVQKFNIKTKIPISSISEALEKEEEEESNRQATPNNQYLYYFCQISGQNNSLTSDNQQTNKPPSSIHSQKYIQELNQNEFSCEINTTLELLNVEEKLKLNDNKSLNESERNKTVLQIQQTKKYQSTASESQFEEEFDGISLNTSDIQTNQQFQKQQTINSETTHMTNKQQVMIPSSSYLQSHQTQPYLIDINSLDDQNSDESLVSFYDEKAEMSSSVFEVQNSKLLQNFFEEDVTSKLQQQLSYPIDVQNPIFDCESLMNNQNEDMQQILSPLYSNNYFIDQQNFHQLNVNNIQSEEMQINQKQVVHFQSDNNYYDETKIIQLENELEQINKKIINRQSQNSISNNSSQLKTTKPTHSRIKSSQISTQETELSQSKIRKNSQTLLKDFSKSNQKISNQRLSLQLLQEPVIKSHETHQLYKKSIKEFKQIKTKKGQETLKLNLEPIEQKNFKKTSLQINLIGIHSYGIQEFDKGLRTKQTKDINKKSIEFPQHQNNQKKFLILQK
ncbi:hypothetical protein TTHERM_00455340 (macronuclear) [Tetrahymena thermophila SB210]|uniref:Uncharacterized protein n=1 Tax=Tetrahymena thermophila (strain SB210) TaxID=312017 RepID=I7M3Q4_TETTS|nr:hypothetical protein TTHERM_00455340 [Tetrahymena thermophila SB210]EAS03895.3 hypothetical protein TTHERM_00455340 [Tetrahymena thermophila SB210]|eukprot:XP_001024140.3 hypothetical protein TTHERM_00455340 [Tetrahymena thermophila SB210]